MRHHRPRHGQHLLFSARKRTRDLVFPLLENGKKGIHLLAGARRFRFIFSRKRAQRKIFLHLKLLKNPSAFGNLTHAQLHDLMRGIFRNIRPCKLYFARLGGNQPRDRVHGGCLTRAVRADQRDDLTFLDVKGNSFDCFDKSVRNLEVFDVEYCHFIHLRDMLSPLRDRSALPWYPPAPASGRNSAPSARRRCPKPASYRARSAGSSY